MVNKFIVVLVLMNILCIVVLASILVDVFKNSYLFDSFSDAIACLGSFCGLLLFSLLYPVFIEAKYRGLNK